MTPETIIAATRSLLETPFVHQGRIPGIALDCAGLVVAVARALDLPVADQADYSRLPSGGRLEAALDAQPCLQRIFTEAQPGDVLLMRFDKVPQHLAILTGENIIHAWQLIGKVAEHGFDAAWRRRVVRVYRFIGVDHG